MCLSRGRFPRKEQNRNKQRDHLRFAELDWLIRTINSIRVGLFVANKRIFLDNQTASRNVLRSIFDFSLIERIWQQWLCSQVKSPNLHLWSWSTASLVTSGGSLWGCVWNGPSALMVYWRGTVSRKSDMSRLQRLAHHKCQYYQFNTTLHQLYSLGCRPTLSKDDRAF